MIRRPQRYTRTETLFPYPTRFRSRPARAFPVLPERRTMGLGRRGHPRRRAAPRAGAAAARAPAAVRRLDPGTGVRGAVRSEVHTSEIQLLMRTSYAVFCFNNTTTIYIHIRCLHTLLHTLLHH